MYTASFTAVKLCGQLIFLIDKSQFVNLFFVLMALPIPSEIDLARRKLESMSAGFRKTRLHIDVLRGLKVEETQADRSGQCLHSVYCASMQKSLSCVCVSVEFLQINHNFLTFLLLWLLCQFLKKFFRRNGTLKIVG